MARGLNNLSCVELREPVPPSCRSGPSASVRASVRWLGAALRARRLRRGRPAAVLGLAWLAMLGPDIEGSPAVEVRREVPQVLTRVFDPQAPPAQMPALGPRERAITHSEFGIGAEVRVVVVGDFRSGDGMASLVAIESLDIDLSLAVTEWLPDDAPGSLVDHEGGHAEISLLFYEDAEAIARRLAGRLVGRTYRGEGRDIEAARRAAMNAAIRELNRGYLRATHVAAARVNDIFDDITDHGRQPIAVEVAIAEALAAFRDERRQAR